MEWNGGGAEARIAREREIGWCAMEGDGVQLHVFGGGNAGATASTVAAAALYSGDAPPQAAAPTMVRERHRVFVKSGVTSEITAEVLHRHFSNFGNVIDVYIPRVLPPQLPKGFAYVSFDCEEAVQRAVIASLFVS